MPIYEFTCETCGDDFEALCRVGQMAEEGCPECGSHSIAKRMSTFVGKSNGNGSKGELATASSRGHCCGGGCGCH